MMEAPFSLTIPQSGCAASESPPEVKSSLLSPTEVPYPLPYRTPYRTPVVVRFRVVQATVVPWCRGVISFSIYRIPRLSTPRRQLTLCNSASPLESVHFLYERGKQRRAARTRGTAARTTKCTTAVYDGSAPYGYSHSHQRRCREDYGRWREYRLITDSIEEFECIPTTEWIE